MQPRGKELRTNEELNEQGVQEDPRDFPPSSLRPETAPPPGAAPGPRITATLHHLPSPPCQKVD